MTALGAGTLAVLLWACVGDDSGSPIDAATNDASSNDVMNDVTTNDTGTDAPPASGFSLSLAPTHVTADPGDAPVSITIDVHRASGFTDNINFTVVAPSGVTASTPPATGTGGTSSSFTLTFTNGAAAGDSTATVTGSNASATYVVNAPLGIHVGSLLAIVDGGVVVPPFASALNVEAWGGGGGSSSNGSLVSSGGAGGYAKATIPVTPGETLVAKVGTGGVGNLSYGAGGGGYTALCPTTGTCLLIAGGGGGGGGGGDMGPSIGSGGAGGGVVGGAGGPSATCTNGAGGGTQSAGGTAGACNYVGSPGSSLQGGAGVGSAYAAGGVPGGGSGGESGGGGGGGGYFGGAGGSWDGANGAGGGGGGSGYSSVDGGTLVAGNGAVPPTVDPRCPAGTAVGGTHEADGGNGCLLIELPKP